MSIETGYFNMSDASAAENQEIQSTLPLTTPRVSIIDLRELPNDRAREIASRWLGVEGLDTVTITDKTKLTAEDVKGIARNQVDNLTEASKGADTQALPFRSQALVAGVNPNINFGFHDVEGGGLTSKQVTNLAQQQVSEVLMSAQNNNRIPESTRMRLYQIAESYQR